MHIGAFIFTTDYGIRIDELARELEQRGFESVFLPEHTHIPASRRSPFPAGGPLPLHYSHTHDPFVALSFAAAAMTKLKLGTGICLLAQRDPIVTAKSGTSGCDRSAWVREKAGLPPGALLRLYAPSRDGKPTGVALPSLRTCQGRSTLQEIPSPPRPRMPWVRSRGRRSVGSISNFTGNRMSDPLYITRSRVEKVDGLHRRGHLEDGTTMDFGVHGPIKAHYGLDAQPDLPLPVDYLVAAASA